MVNLCLTGKSYTFCVYFILYFHVDPYWEYGFQYGSGSTKLLTTSGTYTSSSMQNVLAFYKINKLFPQIKINPYKKEDSLKSRLCIIQFLKKTW